MARIQTYSNDATISLEDKVVGTDANDSNKTKNYPVTGLIDLTTTELQNADPAIFAPISHTHPVTDLETTGTAGNTTYLRGDGVWSTALQSVTAANQIRVDNTDASSPIISISEDENSFTPTFFDNYGLSVSAISADYYRIGKLVSCNILIPSMFGVISSNTASFLISDLPHTLTSLLSSASVNVMTGTINHPTLGFIDIINARPSGSSVELRFGSTSLGAATNLINTQFLSLSLRLNFTYWTNDFV